MSVLNDKLEILNSSKLTDKDKYEKRKKNSLDDSLLIRKDGKITKQSSITSEKPEMRQSYFFQYVSRNKRPMFAPKPFKTPDAGLYRPRYNLIFRRTKGFKYRTLSTVPSDFNSYSPGSTIAGKGNGNMVSRIENGKDYDNKLRDLKKKIDKLRELINNANIDIQALYNENIIDQKVYNMFKSPSITLLQKFENKSNKPTGHHQSLHNPTQIVNIIKQYYALKHEMFEILKNNFNNQSNVISRPRTRASTPNKFPNHTPESDNYYLMTTHCGMGDTPLHIKTSFINDSYNKIHKFESSTPRKVFHVRQKPGKEYDITAEVLDKVRPKTGGFMDFKRFLKKQDTVKQFLNSSIDLQDLSEKNNSLRPNIPMFTLMSKTCGRAKHKYPDIERTSVVKPIPRNAWDNVVHLLDKGTGKQYDPIMTFKQILFYKINTLQQCPICFIDL